MIRGSFGLARCSIVMLSLGVSACGTDASTEPDPESQSGAGGGGSVATNGGSGGDSNPNDPVQDPGPALDLSSVVDFPAGVTVASPVNARAEGQPGPMGPPLGNGQPPPPNSLSGELGFRLLQAGPGMDGAPPPPSSAYASSTSAIAKVLQGEADVATSFDPRAFFTRGGNANCYGPSLAWQNHPNAGGGDPSSGQLPGGDLGIWTASTQDGEACAAAQLNARMRDIEGQVAMGLTGLAGLVAAYREQGHAWPADVAPGDTVDLTSALATAGIANVTFDEASMTLSANGAVWSYEIALDYAADTGNKHIALRLEHAVTDRDAGEFEGLLSYVIEDEYPDRNCGQTASRAMSVNGSVHYIKGAAGLVLQGRNGTACGHASASPAANILSDAVTSAVLSGNAVNPAGDWQDNFNVFTAEFDPETLEGSYAYAWQAGRNDPNTRVLDVGLDSDAAGEAYFGFGDPVQTSLSGEIRGFICNWAGPGNNHGGPDFAKYAQRQFITRDPMTRKFVVADAAASDITYAPTNSCMYDGGGTFLYDRDADGSLSDEDANTAGVMTSGTTLSFDLMTVADGEENIWEHILGRGYEPPAYP